jgi:hypothetical protein
VRSIVWTVTPRSRDPSRIRIACASLAAVAALFAANEADAKGIWVEAGTLTASIASELQAEGQLLADGADVADALARVVSVDGRLDVEVVARSGATIVDRRVDVEGELQPALRVVVLLIADAVSAGPGDGVTLVGTPELPEPKISPSLLELSAGFEGGTWDGATPTAGLFVGVHFPVGAFLVGGRLASTFVGSIQSQAITGGQTSVAGLAEAEYGVWVSRIRIAPSLGLGLDYQSFSGTPSETPSKSPILMGMSPSAPTANTSAGSWALMGRLGIAFEFAYFGDTLVPRLAGGMLGRFPHLAVTVAGETLDPTLVHPWAEIGLKIRIF